MVTIEQIEIVSLEALNTLYDELMGGRADPLKLENAFRTIREDERYVLLGAFVDGGIVRLADGDRLPGLGGRLPPVHGH
ncbi:hypothetical protein ACFSQ7_31005 [Paenibacillus rhizoplanae]